MTQFKLDSRLENDCIKLGKLNNINLLLMNNNLVPWFILVPETEHIELCDLPDVQRQSVYKNIDALSLFIKSYFTIDKLNIAAIGNIVSQLHIHVIGRHKHDYCWPQVVWGREEKQLYKTADIEIIKDNLSSYFQHCFSR